jgi:hypothetical protein
MKIELRIDCAAHEAAFALGEAMTDALKRAAFDLCPAH